LNLISTNQKGGERKETVLWTVLASSQPVGGVGLQHTGAGGVGDFEVVEVDVGVQGGLVAQEYEQKAVFGNRYSCRYLAKGIF